MKMKLFYLPAFALAVALAATGCKHKPVGVTPLPGEGMVGNQGPGTLPNAQPITPSEMPQPSNVATGGGQLAGLPLFENMIMDTNALAAYTIHFAFDSAVIRQSDQGNLQEVASALRDDPSTKLLIEGNCDERGTEEYNRALGSRRALAARKALAKMGIDPMRIRTISYGEDRPVDPAHNEAAWAKNRRDDFVLLHPKAGA